MTLVMLLDHVLYTLMVHNQSRNKFLCEPSAENAWYDGYIITTIKRPSFDNKISMYISLIDIHEETAV